jgi:hypothetical protein
MRPDAFSQPPYDRALNLLRHAGEALPQGQPGDPQWTQALVTGLVRLVERAGPSAPGGAADPDAGPPFAGEVSADERAMLFVPAPQAEQELPS